jgi:hypothetical protein
LTGVEDDDGLADSMLDIAEMTGYGAAIGSLVPIPGVGTGLGAIAGATAGVGTELYQMAKRNTDEGSLSDSLVDIASWTATGAAVGTLIPIPGVGTGLGAIAGATIGVGSELYDWATDDTIPSADIGQVQSATSSSSNSSSNVNNNNVNVEVNIDPNLVTTNTNVNGLIDTDEMNTLNTGG